MGREWGGAAAAIKGHTGQVGHTQHLDGFGGGYGGRSFTVPIEHSELLGVGLRHPHFARNRLLACSLGIFYVHLGLSFYV